MSGKSDKGRGGRLGKEKQGKGQEGEGVETEQKKKNKKKKRERLMQAHMNVSDSY